MKSWRKALLFDALLHVEEEGNARSGYGACLIASFGSPSGVTVGCATCDRTISICAKHQ